jgi:RHS repeat-associated protein
MRIKQASITAALLAVLWILGNPALAEASAPSTLASSRILKTADPFATAPQLDLPSLTQQLRAIEEIAASECVALCALASGIEAHPFGVASAEPPNRSEDAWGNYRFTSELETSHNRFGFTGHYWDKEASLYYAKARYYDPFTARFTQADSFLGTIDDPPSLHRYFYANANPTMYVDPTGHIVDKIVDQQIQDTQYTGRYRDSIGWLYNFANAARQQAGYEAANVFTFGALRRQDKLVDQNLEGKITDQQYWNRTGANVALSGVQAALTIIPGGTAATATRAIVTGATTGVIGQGVSDVGEIYGTKTKSIDDVRASDYFVAAAMGGLSGYAGYKSRPVTIEEPKAPLPPETTGPKTIEYSIAPHGQQTRPSKPFASHHGIQQKDLQTNVPGYDPLADPTIMLNDAPGKTHRKITGEQATQRAKMRRETGSSYGDDYGSKRAAAIEQMRRNGVPEEKIGQWLLEHDGYMFGIDRN